MSSLLGIDLGTSSVKLLMRRADGTIEKSKAPYAAKNPEGWIAALVQAARQLDLSDVTAIGLSSQTGTYVVNGQHVMEWSDPIALEELQEIKSRFPQELFIQEVTMPHPDMISYPIPRILYMLRKMQPVTSVCMPNSLILSFLTGNYVSDIYTWRGLANLETGKYSSYFLNWMGTDESLLPPLCQPTDCVGTITREAAQQTGLPEGAAMYAGCNDYFAALAGTGICKAGDLFDITGTSEHVGGIATSMLPDAPPVSGRYFREFVRYGVTGSSGASLDYGKRLYTGIIDAEKCLAGQPPIFLPYLNGERCPVCDPNARGVFFGINGSCDAQTMAYSVMEGVAFNVRQILETLGITGDHITVTGGAAQDDQLNQLKADVLGMRVEAMDEPDASALGAAMIAGVGSGMFCDLESSIAACIGETRTFIPRSGYDYTDRFEMYKQLYPLLKDSFIRWKEIKR